MSSAFEKKDNGLETAEGEVVCCGEFNWLSEEVYVYINPYFEKIIIHSLELKQLVEQTQVLLTSYLEKGTREDILLLIKNNGEMLKKLNGGI